MWQIYMVRCADGSLYTGITKDLKARIKVHNSGKGSKYTRARLPVELVWSERIGSESKAKSREAQIKKLTRSEKEKLLSN
ncbi:GIY-YIG nuclease family protein [Patescibacteria group bacterium]|nr:GIY-YIG nuclease family protein [Patescibacteria group bacterium]MBU1907218.1 GIY-YIG nuclease family protein [Patescibacteria group bacterium]